MCSYVVGGNCSVSFFSLEIGYESFCRRVFMLEKEI